MEFLKRQKQTQLKEWNESLTIIQHDSSKKEFAQLDRKYCCSDNENISVFVSLLQFLSDQELSNNSLLVTVGHQFGQRQLLLVRELFGISQIDCWKVCNSYIDKENGITCHVGFPTPWTYKDREIFLFSNMYSSTGMMIIQDMAIQKSVYDNLRPKKASIRFRPPFQRNVNFGNFHFLDGDLKTVCYGTPSSTATRLIVGPHIEEKAKQIEYKLSDYEAKINYYNTEIRTSDFLLDGEKLSFDDCYFEQIVKCIPTSMDKNELKKKIQSVSFISPKL